MSEESSIPEEQGAKRLETQVLDEILKEDKPEKRRQLIEFYKVIVENEEQTEQRELLKQQKKFSNVMIVSVFIAVVIILGWVLSKEKPATEDSHSALCLSPEKQQVNLCKTYLLSLKRE